MKSSGQCSARQRSPFVSRRDTCCSPSANVTPEHTSTLRLRRSPAQRHSPPAGPRVPGHPDTSTRPGAAASISGPAPGSLPPPFCPRAAPLPRGRLSPRRRWARRPLPPPHTPAAAAAEPSAARGRCEARSSAAAAAGERGSAWSRVTARPPEGRGRRCPPGVSHLAAAAGHRRAAESWAWRKFGGVTRRLWLLFRVGFLCVLFHFISFSCPAHNSLSRSGSPHEQRTQYGRQAEPGRAAARRAEPRFFAEPPSRAQRIPMQLLILLLLYAVVCANFCSRQGTTAPAQSGSIRALRSSNVRRDGECPSAFLIPEGSVCGRSLESAPRAAGPERGWPGGGREVQAESRLCPAAAPQLLGATCSSRPGSPPRPDSAHAARGSRPGPARAAVAGGGCWPRGGGHWSCGPFVSARCAFLLLECSLDRGAWAQGGLFAGSVGQYSPLVPTTLFVGRVMPSRGGCQGGWLEAVRHWGHGRNDGPSLRVLTRARCLLWAATASTAEVLPNCGPVVDDCGAAKHWHNWHSPSETTCSWSKKTNS